MTHLKTGWRAAAAIVGCGVLAAGCGGDNNNGVASSGATAKPTEFAAFVIELFGRSDRSAPVNIDMVVFAFDSDNDPTAFNTLLM